MGAILKMAKRSTIFRTVNRKEAEINTVMSHCGGEAIRGSTGAPGA
jgi:hypothetical protein